MSADLFPMRPKDCLQLARARNANLTHDELVKEVARLRTLNRELADVNRELAGIVMRCMGVEDA